MNRKHIYTSLALTAAIVFLLVAPGFQAKPATAYNARSASELYGRYCISCHGRDGRSKTNKGRFNHARDLTEAKWQDDVSDERIFNSIMNGRNVRGNMPPFSNKLKAQEAESLVGFVRAFRK